MVIIIFFSFVFSKVVGVSFYGIGNDQCNISNPCDISTAKLKISDNDIILMLDNYTDNPFELRNIQDIFQYGLDKKCTIISHNMTINGSLFDHNSLSFIINNKVDECQITGFSFTEFHSPIFCLRGVQKVYICDCFFYNNSITRHIGLLIITFSTCKISRCNFYDNSINVTSILSIFSSFCIIEFCNISFNNAFYSSNQGLILSCNSICDFVNVTIKFNKNFSPLFQFEWRSYIAFYNSTFANNYCNYYKDQKTLILCDGICEISMYETNMINNNCSIIKATTENARVIMSTANISFNHAGNFALFDIPGSYFAFSMTSVIENNSFLTFVDFHSLKSELFLNHAHFRFNNSTKSFVRINNESSVNLKESSFYLNYCPNGIIEANNISINSFNNGFLNNIGIYVNCQNCKTKIYSDNYINNANVPILNLSSAYSSTTFIFGSYFSNYLNKDYDEIISKGKSTFFFLRFNNSFANLSSHCYLCYYDQKNAGVFTVWTVLLSYSLTFILIILIFRCSYRYLTHLFFNHYKKD